jgi:hypothetical protein
MQMRLGSKRARAADRLEQKGARLYRLTAICLCGVKFKYKHGIFTPERCPDCTAVHVDRFTVFERDRGVGELPANLGHYLR